MLKDDDVEDEDEEQDIVDKEELISEGDIHRAKRESRNKQPTGRVVGILKRNWRS